MKIKYIALAILLIGGGYWYFFSGPQLLERMPRTFIDAGAADSTLIVNTDSGPVLGQRRGQGIIGFNTIPFAAPPIGPLRFQPPQPVEPWSEILDTREPGPVCIQGDGPLLESDILSEDCLWLMVSTPGLDQAKRPVIVWIHGGGYYAGSASESMYDTVNLSARGGVVVVSLQYRLGALGWMDLSPLGGDDVKQSLSSGTLDQIAGLEWVQRNIARFGGDPDNVTIMGESAGSMSVAMIMQRPDTNRLYHKAIMQSGTYKFTLRTRSRREVLDQHMELIDAHSLTELRNKSSEDFRRVENTLLTLGDPADNYTPDSSLPKLVQAAKRGKPILHGTTTHEAHLFYMLNERLPQTMLANSGGLNPAQIDAVAEFMATALPERSETDRLLDGYSALWMHYPRFTLSEGYSQSAPVYAYQFDWVSPRQEEFGAFHAMELPFVFNNRGGIWSLLVGDMPESLALQVQDAWIAFARSGNPNHPGMPEWPAYSSEQRQTMVFNTNSQVVNNPMPWVWELGQLVDELLGRSAKPAVE